MNKSRVSFSLCRGTGSLSGQIDNSPVPLEEAVRAAGYPWRRELEVAGDHEIPDSALKRAIYCFLDDQEGGLVCSDPFVYQVDYQRVFGVS